MRSWSLRFVLRFALLYALLIALASRLPIYVWMEHAFVGLVAPALHGSSQGERSLGIEFESGAHRYRYVVERSGERFTLGGPIHLHGFVALLTLALIAATPDLARTRRAWLPAALAIAIAALLGAGMLLADLTAYERASVPGSPGPCGGAGAAFDGLHRTAGAGLLPLVLWSYAVFRARAARDSLQPAAKVDSRA